MLDIQWIQLKINATPERRNMKKIINLLNEIFIDGLSGMASGLFATLIIGTIISQIGGLIPGTVGAFFVLIGKIASIMTGAGIGVGVATKLKASPLVVVSSATAGMIGSFASKILAGNEVILQGVGEPLGAFIAALISIYMGRLVSGRTKVDILITPFACICAGSFVGLWAGPGISKFMTWLGSLINWGTEQAPFLMGIIVSVLMGMILTLPISSAALGIILGLSGIAAGAATVGCCCNMVGFAVASYKENRVNGLLAQGLGTSMLQISNIVKKPIIWLPVILSSAILGPVSTIVLKMTNNPTGSGMGTAGLVGQINAYQTMTASGMNPVLVFIEIVGMHFVAPAVLTLAISTFMRKKKWIQTGDMRLNV